MGQAASKASEAAKRAAPRVSQAIQANRTRAAADAEWRRSSAAEASATRGGGEYSPTRGQRHEAETAAAIAAAASSRSDYNDSGGEEEVMQEMPPDLIKFLNDAGPLQRTVDKELTSAKVYDSLVTDEKAREEQALEANSRVRRKMPIMSSSGDGSGKGEHHDGSMTERTTNFSTRDRSGTPAGLGLKREDLFRLSGKVEGLKVGTEDWTKMIDNEYKRITRKKSIKTTNFDQLKNMALFENSVSYIGVPIIMKDSEGDIIGVWPSKVNDMQHARGLKVLPESSVNFAMRNEGGDAKES
mmetsp:Transcript_30170/g.72919  ORF Transcript_30170/g.72919 Transcript_30170/m.72919 type:complete len:299 (+) Transcript_30170:71-967(+)